MGRGEVERGAHSLLVLAGGSGGAKGRRGGGGKGA